MLGTRTKSQATDRAESMPQATTTDVFGVQWEAGMRMKAFKNLAKGSVGCEGIQKQPSKAKAKAFVMPRTERQDELTASVIVRGAACLHANPRTEARSSSADPASTKNRVVSNAIVPQLYSKAKSKFEERYRKQKHRKTSSLIATGSATPQTHKRDLLLHDRGLAQFELRKMEARTSKSDCRYIDRGEE